MGWCRQATSHYLSQCKCRSMESLDDNGLNLKKINPPHRKINPHISENCFKSTIGPTNPVNPNMFQEHHIQAQHYQKIYPFQLMISRNWMCKLLNFWSRGKEPIVKILHITLYKPINMVYMSVSYHICIYHLVLCYVVKFMQLIGRTRSRRWNLRLHMSDLQMSYSDLT